ncbi:hypothetical protein BJX99DRAFT_233203, partial [Aspergillus californicus]
MRGLFSRVISDEGHALKQIRTLNHQSIASTRTRSGFCRRPCCTPSRCCFPCPCSFAFAFLFLLALRGFIS